MEKTTHKKDMNARVEQDECYIYESNIQTPRYEIGIRAFTKGPWEIAFVTTSCKQEDDVT